MIYSCLNDCNELVPTLEAGSRDPTMEEIETGIKQFADETRTTWKLGSCDNDVIIVYVQQYEYVRIFHFLSRIYIYFFL